MDEIMYEIGLRNHGMSTVAFMKSRVTLHWNLSLFDAHMIWIGYVFPQYSIHTGQVDPDHPTIHPYH